jgi:hypothetical protein
VSLDSWEIASYHHHQHRAAWDCRRCGRSGRRLAQYHFEEDSGASTFHDSSYANNHAACTTCPAAGQAGQFGKAVQFNTAGQYLSLPAVVNPISTTFSAAAWFQVSNLSGEHTILAQSGSQGRVWLSLNTGGKLQAG